MCGARLLAVLVISALGCGAPPPETEAASGVASERIIGGQVFDGLPGVGALVVDGVQWCTGTLIEKRKVLTAAHCLDNVSPQRMRFVLGPTIHAPDAVIAIASFHQHSAWTPSLGLNDIAYVMLAEDAPASPFGIVPSMDSSWVGYSLLFVGYGVDDGRQRSGAGVKRAVIIAIDALGPYQFQISTPGTSTCFGDSGGPAFAMSNGVYYIAGITSFGDNACQSYAIDTRVDRYKTFLNIAAPAASGTTSSTTSTSSSTSSPCGGETYTGRCDGDTVVWCEDARVKRVDCAAQGLECGFASVQRYYACLAPASDPCAGETYAGRCDGNTVVWCEDQTIYRQSCGTTSRCAFDSGYQAYYCVQ